LFGYVGAAIFQIPTAAKGAVGLPGVSGTVLLGAGPQTTATRSATDDALVSYRSSMASFSNCVARGNGSQPYRPA